METRRIGARAIAATVAVVVAGWASGVLSEQDRRSLIADEVVAGHLMAPLVAVAHHMAPLVAVHHMAPLVAAPGPLTAEEVEARTQPRAGRRAAASSASGFDWDPGERMDVVAAWAHHFLPSEGYAGRMQWTGNVAACTAGTVSRAYLDDSLRRANYYRAQAGVGGDLGEDAAFNEKSQKAALIMSRQGSLSHNPEDDFPSNPCLSADGDEGAARSNLSLGRHGPHSIDALMKDGGAGNAALGHRRWILYLRQQTIGNGAIPDNGPYRAAHAQYVVGSFKPAPPARAVPWPNEGFVPWQIVPNDSDSPPRWSFSWPGANFSAATATVERLGPDAAFLAVTKEAVANGFGDNTLAWRVVGIPNQPPPVDTTYRVTVSGVTGAPSSTYTYDVVVIDPYRLGVDLQPEGPAQAQTGVDSTYTFDGFEQADGYEVRVGSPVSGNWTEGAEDSPPPRVIDETSASYSLRASGVSASGQKSFHLTAPTFSESRQSFTIDRAVSAAPGSVLRFKNMRRCATTTSVLSAQVSRDGRSWTTLWSRAGQISGSCNSSNDWDKSFQSVDVEIPGEWTGGTISVRFLFEVGSAAFLGSGNTLGFFVDDISVSSSLELVDIEETELPANADSFDITPSQTGQWWLQVRAAIGEVLYAWSTPTVVTVGDTPVVVCGDADGNGIVQASDALRILKKAVGQMIDCPLAACDVDANGAVQASDALRVLRKAVGQNVPLTCSVA